MRFQLPSQPNRQTESPMDVALKLIGQFKELSTSQDTTILQGTPKEKDEYGANAYLFIYQGITPPANTHRHLSECSFTQFSKYQLDEIVTAYEAFIEPFITSGELVLRQTLPPLAHPNDQPSFRAYTYVEPEKLYVLTRVSEFYFQLPKR